MTKPKPKPGSNESNDMGNPSNHESELQAQAQTRNAKYIIRFYGVQVTQGPSLNPIRIPLRF